jgi:hypothetical protein
MPTINDDMAAVLSDFEKMDEEDKAYFKNIMAGPNADVIYKIMMEKSAQIKRGECPEPYAYNPMPKMWWED